MMETAQAAAALNLVGVVVPTTPTLNRRIRATPQSAAAPATCANAFYEHK